ncbi:MAG: hypothetical protein LBC68_02730 [Prevotellaceae bacterium]|jgi:hypothetical protein|nr:hypothetical protein [Prevotellaceae bacterium]
MTAFGICSACVVLKAKLRFAQVGRLASICDVAKDATPNGERNAPRHCEERSDEAIY